MIDAIETLRQQGYRIIYSESLVTPEMGVEVDTVTPESLGRAVAPLGLSLEKRGQVWVITASRRRVTSGYVHSTSGQPVSRAYIRVLHSGIRARTDADGYFELPGTPEDAVLAVGAFGYEEQILPADSADRQHIQLAPAAWIENIIVTGSRYHFPRQPFVGSAYYLSAEEIDQVPALAGDAMRVANRLPGVSSVGVTAKPRIRGGLQDEVLILMDGVEMLEPFHLADFQHGYSSIDHRTIQSIDVYTGGFPARYGNRMSGVMDVTTDRTEPEYATELGLSNFSVFVNNRGSSGGERPIDWLLSARHGDLKELTDFMEPRAGNPRYTDATARLGVALGERTELVLGANAAADDVHFTDDEEEASSEIASYYLWSRLDRDHGDSFHSSWLLSYAVVKRDKQELSAEEDGKSGFFDYRQDVDKLALRNDYSLVTDDRILEFGLQLEYERSDYDFTAEFDRGEFAALLGNTPLFSETIDLEPEGFSGGAYLAAELPLGERWKLQPSLRWDFQDYYFSGSREQTSPRLGVRYQLSNDTHLYMSLGRFYQPEAAHELQARDGVRTFFAPQSSDQGIAGLDWQRGELTLKAEIYYKRYRNQKSRFENLLNPFVLLPEMEPGRVRLDPEKAFTRGFDLAARYNFSASLTAHLRYSHMDSQDRIGGVWVPRRWSQRNTVNGIFIWEGNSYTLSAALTWHTGWRSSRLPDAIPLDTRLDYLQVLNNTELREHFSADLSASKWWRLGPTRLTVYGDVTNVLERNNIAGIDFEPEEDEEAGEVFFIPESEFLLPLVATFGFILEF